MRLPVQLPPDASQTVVQDVLNRLSIRYEPYAISSDYTFTSLDEIDSVQVDATSGAVTVTLPESPTGNRRRRVVKTDSSANTITVSGNGNLINLATTYVLRYPNESVTVEPTGTGWVVISPHDGQPSGWVNVRQFGAVGDGVADDTAEIDAVFAAISSGTTVLFPAGTYIYNKGVGTTGISLLGKDNITVIGYGAEIRNTGISHTFQYYPGEFPDLTYYTMTGNYAIGSVSVTLTTAADAGNFAPGDYIWIRTRQTITPSGTRRQPVAEINKIVTADAGTGVLTFLWPLAKPYTKDVVNNDPLTGTLYPHGVALAAGVGAVATDFHFRGIKITHTTAPTNARFPFYLQGIVNCSIQNCETDAATGPVVKGRFVHIDDNRISISPGNVLGDGPYFVAPDTGACDYTIQRNFCTAKTDLGTLHLHEGLANMQVRDNILENKTTGTYAKDVPWGSINLAGLSWNVTVDSNVIINAPTDYGGGTNHCFGVRATDAALYAGEGHLGLVISNNRLEGTIAADGIEVSSGSTGYILFNNKVRATCTGLDIQAVGATAIVMANEVTASAKMTVTDGAKALFNRGAANQPLIINADATWPDGLRLVQTNTASPAPYVYWQNSTDGLTATVFMDSTGRIQTAFGGTPGSTTGTARAMVDLTTATGETSQHIFLGNGAGGGTLKRVLADVPDSGGVGYRLLIITN